LGASSQPIAQAFRWPFFRNKSFYMALADLIGDGWNHCLYCDEFLAMDMGPHAQTAEGD
jgi:hypothetical protein